MFTAFFVRRFYLNIIRLISLSCFLPFHQSEHTKSTVIVGALVFFFFSFVEMFASYDFGSIHDSIASDHIYRKTVIIKSKLRNQLSRKLCLAEVRDSLRQKFGTCWNWHPKRSFIYAHFFRSSLDTNTDHSHISSFCVVPMESMLSKCKIEQNKTKNSQERTKDKRKMSELYFILLSSCAQYIWYST